MKLFGKPNPNDTVPAPTAKETGEADQRAEILLACINALFVFLREYTLDITEIDSERFKTQLAALQEKFRVEEKTKAIATQFDRHKSGILDHIQRQKTYIGEREAEFREIIDLMTAAMTGMDNETGIFTAASEARENDSRKSPFSTTSSA